MHSSWAATAALAALVFVSVLGFFFSCSCSDESKSTKPKQIDSTGIAAKSFVITTQLDSILTQQGSDTTVVYGFELVNAYPHDRYAWTQGLVFEDGVLYEGTGITGSSSIRKVRLETGEILKMRSLPIPYFGEGITIWQDKILQLTWQNRVGFVYDKVSFDSLGLFYYPHEGWGIAHDGTRLIVSDGTPRIRFWDPLTFAPVDSIDAYQVLPDTTLKVRRLNELEYINGKIYANVWMSDLIAIISPETGKLEAWVKLTELVAREATIYPYRDVLNGIAYDKTNDRLFVTGKYWPEVCEIRVVPR
jgi:glutamine cyclotransferase